MMSNSSLDKASTVTAEWALVTGGSGRGGAAISRALHARGLGVVIHHTAGSQQRAAALQTELEAIRPHSIKLWQADFAHTAFSVPAWLAQQRIGVVVFNASKYDPSTLGDLAQVHSDVQLYIGATAQILQALRPEGSSGSALRSVVGISDIAVERSPKGYLSYTTAKSALQAMLLALAVDWAPQVRFNVVQPGTLPFPPGWNDRERMQKIMASIPLGRIGTFEELASAVIYLGLDASYVTGQVLAVDGGRMRQLY